MKGYAENVRRAELSDLADGLLRRMSIHHVGLAAGRQYRGKVVIAQPPDSR